MAETQEITPWSSHGKGEAPYGGSETASESTQTPLKATQFPTPVSLENFRSYYEQEKSSDGLYMVVGRNISRSDFSRFLEVNVGSRKAFVWADGTVLYMPLYVECNRESQVHAFAAAHFIKISDRYNVRLGAMLINDTVGARQDVGGYSRQPDLGIKSASRRSVRHNSNVIGEVLFSQPLHDGDYCANSFLSLRSDVEAVILVSIQYPLPIDANGQYSKEIQLVYHYYKYPGAAFQGGHISPTKVVSFGTLALTQEDVNAIAAVVGCDEQLITGVGRGVTPPCNAQNIIEHYVHRIPGRVLLRTHPHDTDIFIPQAQGEDMRFLLDEVPYQYDMEIDLFLLQQEIMRGIDEMNT